MRLAVASTALAAVTLAGCGGGGSSFDAAKANAICRADRAKLEAIRRPGTILDVKPFLVRALPVLERQRKDVAALPGSDTGDAKAMVARWDDVLTAARRAQRAADEARLAFAMRATHAAKLKADDAADDAGARDCKGFSPFEYRKH